MSPAKKVAKKNHRKKERGTKAKLAVKKSQTRARRRVAEARRLEQERIDAERTARILQDRGPSFNTPYRGVLEGAANTDMEIPQDDRPGGGLTGWKNPSDKIRYTEGDADYSKLAWYC